MRIIKLARLALITTALGLTGCGFHLRGDVVLPEGINRVHIAGGGSSLREEVTNVLTSSGARIASSRDDADAILRLSNEDRKERLLGVDPDTGKAREFELAYSVSFGLQDGSGKALVPTQRLRVVRDYVFDRDALIGKSRERGVLISEMRRDAALQLVRRLSE